jgi:hypothetical protein
MTSSGACFVSSWSGYPSSHLGMETSVSWTTQGFVQIVYILKFTHSMCVCVCLLHDKQIKGRPLACDCRDCDLIEPFEPICYECKSLNKIFNTICEARALPFELGISPRSLSVCSWLFILWFVVFLTLFDDGRADLAGLLRCTLKARFVKALVRSQQCALF